MTIANYIFLQTSQVAGERCSSGDKQAIPMVAGDYASYDTATQKFSLYPNSGDIGVQLYVPYSTILNLTGRNLIGTTAALTGSLPTPH